MKLRQKPPGNQAINNNPADDGMRCFRVKHPCQCGGVAARLTADQLQPGSNPGIGFALCDGIDERVAYQ
jgi:hypothetical protein